MNFVPSSANSGWMARMPGMLFFFCKHACAVRSTRYRQCWSGSMTIVSTMSSCAKVFVNGASKVSSCWRVPDTTAVAVL